MIIGTVHSKSVGKTTLAVHLAGWLDEYGYDVAIIDADWQEQCSTWLRVTSPRIKRHVESYPQKIVDLANELREKHDVVIIDGPAGLHHTPGAVLTVSDAVIVPCGPSAPEIHALEMVAQTIREVQQIRAEESEAKPFPIIVPVKTHPRRITTRVLIEEAAKLGFVSTKNTIPARESYASLLGLKGNPPKLMWQLGRSRDVKAAVKELDSLFQEMFPEASESDPELFTRMMNEPVRRQKKVKRMQEENEPSTVAANA